MLTGWRLRVSKCFLIPQRYIVGIMGFLALANAYTMRISLSVAITEMVKPPNSSTTLEHDDPDSCPGHLSSNRTAISDPTTLYEWTETTQGLILSAFYWGYVITHLPGGILAEKFGGKYTLGLGILSTAVFTLVTPAVIVLSDGDWRWIVALRFLEGLGEGTTYPALNALLAKWAPLHERARIGALVFSGSQVGTIASNFISGALIAVTRDWASVFYFFGGLGVAWFFVWVVLIYSDPRDHPFISDAERLYFEKEIANVSRESIPVPWKAIATSAPVWALIITQIGHDWGFFTMVTDLPKYMKDVLKFNVAENGAWSSVPYIVMWIASLTFGCLCDWFVKKGYMGVGFSRKFFTTIASVGPAVFIILASYSGCNRMLAVGMFTVAMGLMGAYYCGMKVNALDLAPNFAGTIMALVNGIGAVSGMVTPYLVGALTEGHTLKEWRLVFWIAFAVFLLTNLVYVLFGSGREQWWNAPDPIDPKKLRVVETNGSGTTRV